MGSVRTCMPCSELIHLGTLSCVAQVDVYATEHSCLAVIEKPAPVCLSLTSGKLFSFTCALAKPHFRIRPRIVTNTLRASSICPIIVIYRFEDFEYRHNYNHLHIVLAL